MESVGFKEWALVCDAIGRGEQSVILRKGGIAEGHKGFAFEHEEFLLFPTWFHEQVAKTRGADRTVPTQRAGEIEIRVFAKLEFASVVTSWETARELEPFHILQRDIVRERFDYERAPGVHVAFIRGFRLPQPWIIPDLAAYGGCRSWVKLPDFPEDRALEPVLSDDEHARRTREVRAILEPTIAR